MDSSSKRDKGPDAAEIPRPVVLRKQDLGQMVDLLFTEYDVIAPVAEDASIVLKKVTCLQEIATGWRDMQAPGRYQIERDKSDLYFGYANGMTSPKSFLHPGRLTLFEAFRRGDSFEVSESPPPERPLAFFAIHSCDRQAILVLDRTFLTDQPDRYYVQRRANAMVVVANCIRPGNTCFCASMETGPRPETGFDIRMTELADEFLLEAGTQRGRDVLDRLPIRDATKSQVDQAERLITAAVENMGRRLNITDLPRILMESLDHPYWDIMADWCIGCTNCTMVCPTCFCNDVRDIPNVRGDHVVRERVWDSCFARQFAEVHGGNFRPNLKERYRHWCCHKLAYWVPQYGVMGCVGCGRCLTWCPVGIDISAVATRVRGEHP
ncbi:MAG: sulfite reductase subunit A [Chloroflexota bacterium]|nr:MAG: sulfite reductase subunit A [Chloroflexota bacterium]